MENVKAVYEVCEAFSKVKPLRTPREWELLAKALGWRLESYRVTEPHGSNVNAVTLVKLDKEGKGWRVTWEG